MARVRSLDFLPEIFQTDTNNQFLSSTLDQLVQEPKLKPTQGLIGRDVGVGVTGIDKYLVEPTKSRSNYQLEPSVVNLAPGTQTAEDAITYPGMLSALGVENGFVNKHDRLWKSEQYSWDPNIDFDKFINFGQYYWLPEGPETVNVSKNI